MWRPVQMFWNVTVSQDFIPSCWRWLFQALWSWIPLSVIYRNTGIHRHRLYSLLPLSQEASEFRRKKNFWNRKAKTVLSYRIVEHSFRTIFKNASAFLLRDARHVLAWQISNAHLCNPPEAFLILRLCSFRRQHNSQWLNLVQSVLIVRCYPSSLSVYLWYGWLCIMRYPRYICSWRIMAVMAFSMAKSERFIIFPL